MISLGLDIGSNSVGSAWIDTDQREIHLGASIFPAGVDERDDKRGAPMNQARRLSRSQRRTIHRRAARKRRLVRFLMERGLLPRECGKMQEVFDLDPWLLRGRALNEPLTPHEFGRILVHLAQRRGAVGVETDPENEDEGKVKEGMDRLNALMAERGAASVGQLMCGLITERRREHDGATWQEPIRNRQYRMPEDQMLFAGRELIRKEFHLLVERQRTFKESSLAPILTDELIAQLDDQRQTDTWRHGGYLFRQRRTYWDTGTLGRCDLEPTERCAPMADRHAQEYRVVETVNNIKIERRGETPQPLSENDRAKVMTMLRGPLFKKSKGKLVPKASASVTDIKQALGLSPRDKTVRLNIEADESREINSDWFYREVVHGVFTEDRWTSMTEDRKESVNRAILKFNPDESDDEKRLREGAKSWWGLDDPASERLIAAWKGRPRLEKRLSLSRRAICNLLPLMNRFDEENQRWPTQQEARKAYAKTLKDEHARRRYETGAAGLGAADRRYMRLAKHQIAEGVPALPPAPMLSNPVVRKTIHEVRRHVIAYLRLFGRKPDRVVIEYARGVKDTAKQRNAQLAANRKREEERRAIEKQLRDWNIAESNWKAATLRVRLCQEQKGVCPFSLEGPNANRTITDKMAAEGTEVEIEHIIPEALTGKTMAYNNLVLCFREANRGKGMRTPADWLGAEKLATMLQRLENAPIKNNRAKWERLKSLTPDEEGFRNSQLTDTAYAARQVAAYISDALFEGKGLPERGGERRIFTTKGEFTARLRADWGLHESTIDRMHGLEAAPSPGQLAADPHLEQSTRRARKEGKDRTDHRHHAIDALVTAMVGPELLTKLGRMARQDREYRERTGHWPRRTAIEPPKAWPTPEDFHRDVFAAFERLVTAHRPVKRRLVGKFHEETHYGPVLPSLPRHRTESAETLFTNRISADRLSPNHLRVPDGWDQASAALDDPRVSEGEKRAIRRRLAGMKDLSPGKSGIVRDRALRDRIRKCLRAHGVDPDGFNANQIKPLVRDGKLTMKSGVPIKGVVLLRTNADPVIIPRKKLDAASGKMVPDPDPRTARVYIGGNNHHVPIRADRKSGKWTGRVVSTFEAAKRVRQEGLDAVDRTDDEPTMFVMSLAEGEMIYARRKDRPDEPPNYYVVCKLDKSGNSSRIHFAPHWDARKASEQDRWDVAPGDLKNWGASPGQPPHKVRIGPLGEVRMLVKD